MLLSIVSTAASAVLYPAAAACLLAAIWAITLALAEARTAPGLAARLAPPPADGATPSADDTPSRPWVLVTGTSSGIGLATAAELVTRGFGVYATVRRADDGDALRAAVGGPASEALVRTVVCDVTREEEMAAVGEQLAQGGRLWGLVACAGVSVTGTVEETPAAAWAAQLEVNVVGTVRTIHAALPALRASPGARIVVVGSLFGLLAEFPGFGPYAASKFALEALVRTLREELAPAGIAVTMINPAGIATPFIRKLAAAPPPDSPLAAHYAPAHARFRAFVAHTSTGSPVHVARTIARAISSARPFASYPVGPQAQLIAWSAALLPAPLLQLMARTGFPQHLLFHVNAFLARIGLPQAAAAAGSESCPGGLGAKIYAYSQKPPHLVPALVLAAQCPDPRLVAALAAPHAFALAPLARHHSVAVSALAAAAAAGNVDVVAAIAAIATIDPNAAVGLPLPLLLIAVDEGHAALVDALCTASFPHAGPVAAGATLPDIAPASPRLRNSAGWPALLLAAHAGHAAVVSVLLRHGAPVDESASAEQITPLWAAAWAGHPDIVALLLDAGADPAVANPAAATPLFAAAQRGHAHVITLLLAAGASPAASMASQSPLWIAAAGGHLDAVITLLDAGADPAAADAQGNTPLFAAAMRGHLHVMQHLVALTPPEVLAARNTLGAHLLLLAAFSGSLPVVRYVVDGLGFDVNETSHPQGLTALATAALQGALPLVAYLVDAGADISAATDPAATPIALATLNGHSHPQTPAQQPSSLLALPASAASALAAASHTASAALAWFFTSAPTPDRG
ncbi:uncharacterized protein AMSG_12342 [Thecamonas trahens ATCC 50062]|uniref:Ketoreductase domain-containing protein n=1 Tax=Thecamonas trahens ATCC 50062 TaxID=461836 RepID=A0A0L0DPX5_THETB|nr:hypothetical protein AMSG_12342 [Thecamonas trahens ATCC 50062]KNC54320.1 hypothetical protein AMSG_12342 [Thecamonas trahens ATCC 50062]|eukprot:XP_013753825.1 hypothetical protein AMSG_12342 [Thecamonas trahens ATCC 50062]